METQSRLYRSNYSKISVDLAAHFQHYSFHLLLLGTFDWEAIILKNIFIHQYSKVNVGWI